MSDDGSLAVFEPDRNWLAERPEMQPWPQGCRTLKELLDRHLGEYSAVVCERRVDDGHEHYRAHFCRLWSCLGYHWQQAIAQSDGQARATLVTEQLRAGEGFQRGGRLGGDPMRDVVLAVAVTRRDGRATECFQGDYYQFATTLAGKVHERFRLDADEWWNEFVDHLAGYTKSPGKLERFFGKCALRNWLGTVLWRFLRRRPLPGGGDDAPLEAAEGEPAGPTIDPAHRESVVLFAKLAGRALADLDKNERAILCFLFADGLKLKDAARILGIHSGNAGRLRDRATDALCRGIAQHAREADAEAWYRDLTDQLTDEPKDFARVLRDALTDHSSQEGQR